MKLTNAQLKQIIKEELRSVLKEHWQRRLGPFLMAMDIQIGERTLSVKEIMEKIIFHHTEAISDGKQLGPTPVSVVDQRLNLEWWQILWPATAFDKLISILKNKASDWEDDSGELWFSKHYKDGKFTKPFAEIKPWELS